MDLEPAACFLIDVDGAEPLIAVERYDRVMPEHEIADAVDGLPAPFRLHQEDMCQAIGLSSGLKYEPSAANYLNHMADVLRRELTLFNEDRLMLSYYQLFDYLVGNCDNHLKNWSMLWDKDWRIKRLAPLYDVVDTTLYPNLVREMGVSFGGSRRIDDVGRADVLQRLASCGVAHQIAGFMVSDMVKETSDALEAAAARLVEEGFPAAERVLKQMLPGVRERAKRIAG